MNIMAFLPGSRAVQRINPEPTLSHCLPEGSGQGILPAQPSVLEETGRKLSYPLKQRREPVGSRANLQDVSRGHLLRHLLLFPIPSNDVS
jgi:hypothetical protein